MLDDLIRKKASSRILSIEDYYEAIEYLLKRGVDKKVIKFFLSLNSFGMSKKEVLYLTLAMRDSGRVLKFDSIVMEKHSTGGVGDPSSIILIPLLASLGYKVIKTTGKSFMFTNGSSDRYGAIPGFKEVPSTQEIHRILNETNSCVLSHKGDICPADRLLFDVREACELESNLNLLAASIACKKLASGAKIVLVDIKYGLGSIVKNYRKAKELARILKYIFNECEVKSIMVITNASQPIGEAVGNAIEVADALKVLQGRKCLLRTITTQFALEMIHQYDTSVERKDIIDMINISLDNGYAYNKFLDIISAQGGDVNLVDGAKLFNPYKSVNFISDRAGYVGTIDSLLLGELIRRLCVQSHDNNIGIALRVKIGEYVNAGDIILTLYYKDDEDLARYKSAISGCVRLTTEPIKPIEVIKRIIR